MDSRALNQDRAEDGRTTVGPADEPGPSRVVTFGNTLED